VSSPEFAPEAIRFLEAYKRRRSDFGGWAAAIWDISGLLRVIGPVLASAHIDDSLTLVACGALTFLPFHLA
jgi:hypothetical protein